MLRRSRKATKAVKLTDQQDYLRILSQAVQEVGKAQNYTATLKHMVQSVVPAIADWCAVDIADDQGRLQRLAIAHVNPKKASKALLLASKYPRDSGAESGTSYVYRTGEPNMQNAITDDMLVAAAINDEHLTMMRELEFRSMMIVPIRFRNKIFGTLSFVWSGVDKAYSLADLAFAEVLATLAGNAINMCQPSTT